MAADIHRAPARPRAEGRRAFATALALGPLLATLSTPAVHAQQLPAGLAGLAPAERSARLVEGARREVGLNLYTSLTQEDMAALNGAFERRYGVKVKMWRASGDKVLQRVLAEQRAGRFEVDVVEANALTLESLQREHGLQPVNSPLQGELIAGAVPAHRGWVASRLNVFVQAYHTGKVPAATVPHRYEDLLDPRWKGRIGAEASDDDWFSVVVQKMGEARGLQFFRELVRTNGVSVRRGHTLLTSLVASGEVPYALTVYNFTAEQLRLKGAPIAWHVLEPAVARANGLALPQRVPNPHAALLYYDFMIGDEGQRILIERGFVPTQRKAPSPLGATALTVVDAARLLDDGDKWARLYEDIIVKQNRN